MFASRENLHPATSHQTLLDLLRFQKFSICNHTCENKYCFSYFVHFSFFPVFLGRWRKYGQVKEEEEEDRDGT